MVVWERVIHVEGPGGAFVVRARPSELPPRIATWSLLVVLVANLRQLLRRTQDWTVSVRRPENDPWGPSVYAETFTSKQDALESLERIGDVLRTRDVPSLSAPD